KTLLPHYSYTLFDLLYLHRDLLSFPTRRSSDLEFHHPLQVGIPPLPGVAHLLRARDHRDHAHGRSEAHGQAAQRAVRHGPASLEDRKSTRLNSSHVKISYAVFCLKKKKSI